MTDANRITLRPLTVTEYAAFRARSMQDYAEEMRANVGVTPEAALERARTQTDELLPVGQATPGHHFLGIVRDDQLVGDLWINLRDHLGAL
ncbi:MAG: hypothetical protein H7287_05130, partial [Thermoleophilia bacterium]|nr:hypothetical protein [Thermoleophilia bacterium]